MSMSLRENITAVIETCFSETKDEIQDTAINRILELIRADRKTENCSEKPNNCDDCIWSVCNYNKVTWDEEDEPKNNCRKCKHIESEYQTPISSDGKYYTYVVCTASECRYESKTEPETDNGIGCSRCEGRFDCCDRDMPHAVNCNNYGKVTDEPQTCRNCKWSQTVCRPGDSPPCHSYEPKDEPLTCDGNCWMKKQNGEWLCEHCQREPKTETEQTERSE